jgi:hypothetical protein
VTLESPLFQQVNTYSARQIRSFVAMVFDIEGVLLPSSGGLLVAQRAAGTNMSVDIAAGSCVVVGDDEANQGSYFCKSTAVENVVIGAAPGSDSRIDLVVARVRDATVTGGVSSDWILEVIPGTVAASPVVPATPATAIPLAKVLVTAGDTAITNAMITDLRTAAASSPALAKANNLSDLTNAATARANLGAIAMALADVKGDLLVADAADSFARLPVGANGYVPTAASGEATGLKYAPGLELTTQGLVSASETTTSTTYADLATVGPAATVTVGPSGRVLVILSAHLSGSAAADGVFMSYAISGATTVAAGDDVALHVVTQAATNGIKFAYIHLNTGLAAGPTTWTAKYRITADTATFRYRRIIVIPL